MTTTNAHATEWEITYEYRYDRQMLLPGLDVIRDGASLRLREPRDSMPKGASVAFRSEWKVVASHLTLVLLLAALPVAYLGLATWSAFRGRQGPSGLCPTCGYDLRATPERCPECGAAAGRGEAAATSSADGSGSSA